MLTSVKSLFVSKFIVLIQSSPYSSLQISCNHTRSEALRPYGTNVFKVYQCIVGPPPPPLLKGGRTFQKLSHLGGAGVPKMLLERGDNPEKGGAGG